MTVLLDLSCLSRVEDVHRCVWSQWQRCPANPAFLLASSHGGDQEPDCGRLSPSTNDVHLKANIHIVSNEIMKHCLLLACAECCPTVISRRIFVCRNCPLLESRKLWNWMRMWRYKGCLNYFSYSHQMNSSSVLWLTDHVFYCCMCHPSSC